MISVNLPELDKNISGNSGERGFSCYDIVGDSRPIRELFSIIRKVSLSDSSILITGESGTGKELVARTIHRNSLRSNGPMVVINCGAIPGELLESELFGHEKGAFTGAHRARTGRFELADNGTIFLDEIGDMSPDLQVKLLRAIQERKIERVGGTTTIDVNIRILSATNKDLAASMEHGSFREDLFYRLNVIPIHIPPLRERSSDIPLLVDYFQQKLVHRTMYDYKMKKFSGEALKAMLQYSWPGNVRELENLVERLSVLIDDPVVDLSDLPEHIVSRSDVSIVSSDIGTIVDNGIGFNEAVESYQKALITHALKQTDWVKARAAELLKMNRTTLVEKIKKLNIQPENGPFI